MLVFYFCFFGICDVYGNLIGTYNKNPMLNTAEYIIEFTDSSEENMMANSIAENIYSQIDSEGRQYQLLKDFINHKHDLTAVRPDEGYVVLRSGKKMPKKTTRGWKLLAVFKDGTHEWLKLKDLKEAFPVQVAEYAVNNMISHEPAFNWWVHEVLKKRDRIISKVKGRYWRTTHKFGISVPKTVEEALEIDEQTGTRFWSHAIAKEMTKAKVAWISRDGSPTDARKGKVSALHGYQEIKCHIVFDVNMDLTRKARFCANGNETSTPASAVYSSVVSRDSVRLAFLIASLNDLDILATDITNAYLNAPVKEKIWFEGGSECGDDKGKICV